MTKKANFDDVLDDYYAPIKIPDVYRSGLKQRLYMDLRDIVGAKYCSGGNPCSCDMVSDLKEYLGVE